MITLESVIDNRNSSNLCPAKSKTKRFHKEYDQIVIPEVIKPNEEYEEIQFGIPNYVYVEERVSITAFKQLKEHVSEENHLQILNGTFQYLDSAIRRLLKEWAKNGIVKKFDMIIIRGNSYDFTKLPFKTQERIVEEMKMISMDIYNPSAYDNQVVSFKCLIETKIVDCVMDFLNKQIPNIISEGIILSMKRAIKTPYYFVDTFEFDVACSKEKPWVRFVSNQNFIPSNTYPLESNLTNREKKLYYKNYMSTAQKKALKKKQREFKRIQREKTGSRKAGSILMSNFNTFVKDNIIEQILITDKTQQQLQITKKKKETLQIEQLISNKDVENEKTCLIKEESDFSSPTQYISFLNNNNNKILEKQETDSLSPNTCGLLFSNESSDSWALLDFISSENQKVLIEDSDLMFEAQTQHLENKTNSSLKKRKLELKETSSSLFSDMEIKKEFSSIFDISFLFENEAPSLPRENTELFYPAFNGESFTLTIDDEDSMFLRHSSLDFSKDNRMVNFSDYNFDFDINN